MSRREDLDPSKWSVTSLRHLAIAIESARRHEGRGRATPTRGSARVWLKQLFRSTLRQEEVIPGFDNVCSRLQDMRAKARVQGDEFASDAALWIRVRLGCQGGLQLTVSERYTIVHAVEAIADPGVPVDLDYWLEHKQRDDLCYVLEEYLGELEQLGGRTKYARLETVEKLIEQLCKRSEPDRMMDFFFPRSP